MHQHRVAFHLQFKLSMVNLKSKNDLLGGILISDLNDILINNNDFFAMIRRTFVL